MKRSRARCIIIKLATVAAVATMLVAVVLLRPRDINERLVDAVKGGDAVLVRSLLERGADANTHTEMLPPYRPWPPRSFSDLRQWFTAKRRPKTWTPTMLMLASEKGRDEICSALIEHGAVVNDRNFVSGFSPLMFAAINEHFSTVCLLLDNGANANEHGWDEYDYGPPMVYAAAKNDIPLAKALLKHGADPNWAMGYALGKKQQPMRALLKQYGAKEHPVWTR